VATKRPDPADLIMANYITNDPNKARNHSHFYTQDQLAQRVESNLSSKNGQLEDQNADLDVRTLAVLGKRQHLNRNFGMVSIIAFSTTLQASWASVACTFQDGMVNGGPVSLVWGRLKISRISLWIAI
jgi:hypothetical protein